MTAAIVRAWLNRTARFVGALVVCWAIYQAGAIDGHIRARQACVAERDNLWLRALGVALAPKEPV